MLKKMMIRIAKVAVLASLIVSLVVMGGCKWSAEVHWDGEMVNGLCKSPGNSCEVTIKAESD